MAADVYSVAVTLPLEKAREIVRGALADGRRQGIMPLTVAVLDSGGHLVAMEREDGSGILRLQVAVGKAYGALGIGLGSRTVGARNKGREHFLAALSDAADGRCVPVPGGVLVLDSEKRIIGAVGVSGDASDADEAAALAGIKAAGLKAGIDPTED
ncbi:MAG: heme-binding protein [Ectothiorhodospiraceae bacterium]|jgi:uncharacterized protein GlcG (DUF336 family)